MQAWQHGADMQKRIVVNALCSWAEAVSLSAGENIGTCRDSIREANVEVFQEIRQVSNFMHAFVLQPVKFLHLCALEIGNIPDK